MSPRGHALLHLLGLCALAGLVGCERGQDIVLGTYLPPDAGGEHALADAAVVDAAQRDAGDDLPGHDDKRGNGSGAPHVLDAGMPNTPGQDAGPLGPEPRDAGHQQLPGDDDGGAGHDSSP